MALQPCRVCGAQVSTEDRICPACGADDPTRRRRLGCLVFMLAGLTFIGASYGVHRAWQAGSAPPTGTATGAQPVAAEQVLATGPADPNQEAAPVAFTLAMARALPQAFTLEDLQRAAGSLGRITFRDSGASDPKVVYRWNNSASGRSSTMLATVRPSGFIEVQIRTAGDVLVTFNNKGEVYCDPLDCRPRR
ncbi:MAG: hypothetical protein JO264_16830 [Acidisphaera sp.]|nr:hypothetical protein [Acidisphaera sp.]